MLDRIVMNVICMAFKITLIPNLVFPKPTLPKINFMATYA